MHALTQTAVSSTAVIDNAARAAIISIPPLWPLAASVAVNPFLGQASEPLEMAAARLARTAGVALTMPRSWFAAGVADRRISDTDLADALAASTWHAKPDVAGLLAALDQVTAPPVAIPTVADLAAAVSGIDWPGIIADRIGHWAAGFFDEGQALWRAGRDGGAYWCWRQTATHDLTPELLGLTGFARFVATAPETARGALSRSVATLGLGEAALEGAFARALTTMGGWSQLARFRRFESDLAGTVDDTALDLLAIRLLWDEALFEHYGDHIADRWRAACAANASDLIPDDEKRIDAILQHAVELGAQRRLAALLSSDGTVASPAPDIQAVFCIDVRSEIFRRAFESVDLSIQTLGFAGFFGLGTAHRRFASDVVERRLPVLLNPDLASYADGKAGAADLAERYSQRASRAWGRFKLAAVSSFAFVEAAGPIYLLKLVRDAMGHVAPARTEPPPVLDPPLTLDAQVAAAETVLRAMSLTQRFAPLVLIVGHGAQVTNNPHASALQCGACGGYSGEVNARLLASLLNDTRVRTQLATRGIDIPEHTAFVGALHDTTSDVVTLYDHDLGHRRATRRAELDRARSLLDGAGNCARAERMPRLPRAGGAAGVLARARDWAETRPEWGLAGAQAFIAAPRSRTLGRSLEGRAFLHDYDWRSDEGFKVLELILTAPVVVASWISLQYYGSAVAPTLFGGGNKLLHNVTGGVGVVEGNGGVLRGGLPWQSVHDGTALMHEPLRLSVYVEAPAIAVGDIIKRHEHLRSLFHNQWLHLVLLNDEGLMTQRYDRGDWQDIAGGHAVQLAPALI